MAFFQKRISSSCRHLELASEKLYLQTAKGKKIIKSKGGGEANINQV